MGINWTEVIVFGVPAYIAAVFGGVAAIMSARNNRSLRTTNGHEIGELVEATHAAVNEGVATAHDVRNEQTRLKEGDPHV